MWFWAAIVVAQTQVEVFTLHHLPLPISNQPHVKVTVYHLDALPQLQQTFNQRLHDLHQRDDKTQAAIQAKQLLQQYRVEFRQAVTGLVKAQRYGITQLPTIVINQQVQIVGTTHIAEALQHYAHYQRQHRARRLAT
ncbi:MAG: DUF1525 domain-containing protein [Gammaproteobacteria bacterium]|nr:DUF1525 domain-containing protein [Gammaproteobacteria bacterium]